MRNSKLLIAMCVVTVSLVSCLESDSDVVHHSVDVAAANDEWTDTGVSVDGGDLIVIFVKGDVTIGSLYGEVGADGAVSGAGRLYAKVGTTKTLPVGSEVAFVSSESGSLKLRVHDEKYLDNSGSFNATVMLVPAEVIPDAVVIGAE